MPRTWLRVIPVGLHPIRLVGRLIAFFEKCCVPILSAGPVRNGGVVLCAGVSPPGLRRCFGFCLMASFGARIRGFCVSVVLVYIYHIG